MIDRTYWSAPTRDGREFAWHATKLTRRILPVGACGRKAQGEPLWADRIPSDGHLCGSCARVIAAQTDEEG